MAKQRRNDPCNCGSGRKFKHCHGSITETKEPSADAHDFMLREIKRIEADEHRRRLMQGLGKPIISFMSNGFRCVAVGMELRWSKDWKTFADFLMDYIKINLTPDWGITELRKPLLEQHPLIGWFKHIGQLIKLAPQMPNEYLRESTMDGATRAFLGLAYDLFCCAHNARTQHLLVKRLRKRTSFGGALYEANVIGWFVRAGFSIEFEDESDPRTTHCEFTATHLRTGKKFSVEAKSIGDASSRAGNSVLPPRVRHKITEALHKKAGHTRIVFIDLNRAEHITNDAPPIWEQTIHDEIAQAETDMTVNDAPAPPAYIMMTNRGYLHRLNEVSWSEFAIVAGFKIPDFPIGKGCSTILEAYRARERHIEVYWLSQAMIRHNVIPNTFDATTPEEAFAASPTQRLRMGETYSVNLRGKEVPGILVDAHVDVNGRNANGVLRTANDGDVIVQIPLSDVELAIYRRDPDTFFDVVKPVRAPLTRPLDYFDFLAEAYFGTPKHKLLEWMKDWPEVETIRELNQREIAEIYCDRLARSMWHTTRGPNA